MSPDRGLASRRDGGAPGGLAGVERALWHVQRVPPRNHQHHIVVPESTPMEIRIRCPRCGYAMLVFDESLLRSNRALRRAYEHALKNPVLCAGCSTWVQRPKVDKGIVDGLPASGDRRPPRPIG